MKLAGGQREGVIVHHHPLLERPSCMSPNCSFTFFFSKISLQHYYWVQIDAVSTASQKLPSHLAQPDPPAKKANKKNDLKSRFLKFKGLTTSKVPGDIAILPTCDRWNFLGHADVRQLGPFRLEENPSQHDKESQAKAQRHRNIMEHRLCGIDGEEFPSIFLWGFLVNDLQKGVHWIDVSCTILPPWHTDPTQQETAIRPGSFWSLLMEGNIRNMYHLPWPFCAKYCWKKSRTSW